MITRSLNDVVESVYTTTAYEISITPQNAQSLETMQGLLETQTREIAYIAPGYNMTVGVEGFESTNPFSAGTNQVSVTGIDPTQPSIAFELMEGTGWQGDSAQAGVVVSRVLASALDKNVGDEITLTVGAQTRTYPIIGVHNYPFDAVYMHWQDLATLGNYVDDEGNPLASVFYVGLTGEHSLGEIDDQIEILSSGLLATGIQASYTNQREVEATQAQQITLFGMVFSMSAGVMAAVGAIGLMATLSMAVYERQKEIGVVRSIGASSRSIITQFMLEGMMVGFLAWVVAVPLSLVMGLGLVQILPFDYLNFTVMPQYLLLGLLGVLLVAGLSSLGPSWLAARKTVSEILRYQ
jgi:putative ABC transport system permease protein